MKQKQPNDCHSIFRIRSDPARSRLRCRLTTKLSGARRASAGHRKLSASAHEEGQTDGGAGSRARRGDLWVPAPVRPRPSARSQGGPDRRAENRGGPSDDAHHPGRQTTDGPVLSGPTPPSPSPGLYQTGAVFPRGRQGDGVNTTHTVLGRESSVRLPKRAPRELPSNFI